MVDDYDEHEDEEIAEEPRSYEEMATAEPPREEEALPEVRGKDHERTLTEAVDETAELSDMQTAARAMFPKDLCDSVGNKLMIGRVAPDAFLDVIGMRLDDRMMMSDPEKEVDFDKMLTEEYIVASIGLDGRGRIDYAELVGAAREQKELKDRIKEL